jgi:hypothetical protein
VTGARSARLACLTALALYGVLATGGCEFAQVDEGGPAELNSCSTSDDCGSDGECVGGMCVADEAAVPLSVVLEVTPVRPASDGTPPSAILLRPLLLDAPMDQPIEVPRPVELLGRVRDGQRGLEAEVRFTPLATLPGLLDPSVTVTTTPFAIDDDHDFAVNLSRGVDYRVTVRPTSGNYPPFRTTLRAGEDPSFEVDYDPEPGTAAVAGVVQVPLQPQLFRIDGAPDDRPLRARAFDIASGEPVSSSALVVDGEVTLAFAADAPAWRLEIRAEQSYEPVHGLEGEGLDCDEDTPVYPVFSVLQESLSVESDGAIELDLPEPPPRIRYEGTVALCPASADDKRPPAAELSMTLRSDSLLLEKPRGITAAFEATTTVRRDAESGALRFCVQLMEGEYDVVVTPPSDTGCGLFAERRLIKAPDDIAATGSLLELHPSAWLQGKLKTHDLSPLADASVDALALAREGDVMLAEDDPSVTRYNRSQQTTSDQAGTFRLAVDLGSYDVVVKAPAGSGYPWVIRHDVGIGARGVEFPTVIDMLAPITLQGSLGYQGDEEDLADVFADAEISAFAILDEGLPTARAVPIGKTTADPQGRFMLLLPPSLKSGW